MQVTSRQKYFVGPLNFSDRIENGFYDPGHQIANEPLTSLESYQTQAVDLGMREVILIDEDKDERLIKYLGLSRTLVRQASSFEAKLSTLALFVSHRNPFLSDSLTNLLYSAGHYSLGRCQQFIRQCIARIVPRDSVQELHQRFEKS